MQRFNFIIKLVVQQMLLHPGRAWVTIAGIAASACAVVWVVSGYDALVSQFDENAGKYLGRYDLLLVPEGPPGKVAYIDAQTLGRLAADPGILELNPIQQSRVSVVRVPTPGQREEDTSLGLLVGTRPPVNGAPPIDPILVSTSAKEAPYDVVKGNWLSDDAVVLSSGAAEQLHAQVGDLVLITTMVNQLRLPVVGIVEQTPEAPSLEGRPKRVGAGSNTGDRPHRGSQDGPTVVSSQDKTNIHQATEETTTKLGIPSAFVQGIATNAMYVRPAVAERLNGFPARPTVLQVALRDTIGVEQFIAKWREPLSASRPALQIVDFSAVRAGLTNSRSASAQRSQAYAAAGFASLAAVFIIFSLLSMGVSERTREFALLRAVALSRLQIAAMVTVESLILAMIGWLSGLAAGMLLIIIGSRWMPSLLYSGAELGWTCFWMTGATVFLGAIGAAVIPAWKASNIKPLDALSSARWQAPPRRTYAVLAVLGLVFAIAAPLSVLALPLSADWRVWCYSIVTYPALLLGMVLMTPAIVILTERLLGAFLAALFRLDARLFKSQLSNNLLRTIGAALALSVGLGLFASTQTWGYSMLQPFLPGKWLPDMLVAFQPSGLDAEGIEAVKQTPGVVSEEVMPLAIEQAMFDWGEKGAPKRINSDNAVVFGIDPEAAIASQNALLDLKFVDGDRLTAARELSAGTSCIISLDFHRASGLTVGDTLSLIPPNAESERVVYRIAAVVDLPGWQWVTKFSGVRRHFVRTSTMIFVDRHAVLRDFHLPRPEFCWMNLTPEANLPSVEADMQRIAEKHSGGSFQADGLGKVVSYRPFARATATQTVTRAIKLRADGMIWSMSQLPLITLFIMSLAVVNAVIAAVRARQWEFGILRSLGTTRWQLVRLVVAETLLIGVVACLLSLTFGLIAGWCGVGMASYGHWGAFVGEPSFLVPWRQLAFGFGIALGLCVIAAAWPALSIGRSEPLDLLAAGRSAR